MGLPWRDPHSDLALLDPLPNPNVYRITSPDEEVRGAAAPGVLANDGKFQGTKLEKILHLHRRDQGTVLESYEATGEKEGGGPGISPSSPGPGAPGVQK